MTAVVLRSLVDGVWVPGDGHAIATVSPIDGVACGVGAGASVAQAGGAMTAAATAFPDWRRTPAVDRDAVVRRFTDLVTEHRDELAELISREIGKTKADAAGEVHAIIGKADLSVTARDTRTGKRTSDLAAGTLHVGHRPLGPVVVLGPFNFPGHLPNGHITPALLAGNTVVFKPSEQGAVVGQRMVELWVEAGLPVGVLQLVHGGVDVVEALIDHEHTAAVLFTGGVEAGRAIHRRLAGRPEVLLALELGGNNPVIVWNVDDVAATAELIVRSAFLSSGQRCTCARRLIVSSGSEGDAIVDAVVEQTRALPIGEFMGPVVSASAADRVLTAQQRLLDLGATALVASERLDLGAAYLSAGVLDVTDVGADGGDGVDGVVGRPDEEIFGPMLQVIRVDSLDAALAEANDTQFGLAAAVFTDDDDVWERLEPELEAGIVNRNVMTVGASGAAPFGGTGASGNHRPAGFHAADYVAHPVAGLVKPRIGARP